MLYVEHQLNAYSLTSSKHLQLHTPVESRGIRS